MERIVALEKRVSPKLDNCFKPIKIFLGFRVIPIKDRTYLDSLLLTRSLIIRNVTGGGKEFPAVSCTEICEGAVLEVPLSRKTLLDEQDVIVVPGSVEGVVPPDAQVTKEIPLCNKDSANLDRLLTQLFQLLVISGEPKTLLDDAFALIVACGAPATFYLQLPIPDWNVSDADLSICSRFTPKPQLECVVPVLAVVFVAIPVPDNTTFRGFTLFQLDI